MFALALPKLTWSREFGVEDSWNYDRGIHGGQIIHFGASLKVIENTDFADQWLQKFEQQVLTQLVWRTAVVHFEHETAGECTVRYAAATSSIREVYEDFRAVGCRVEAGIQWTRDPATAKFS
jgi:hypothetical protein